MTEPRMYPEITRDMYARADAFVEGHKRCDDLVTMKDGTPIAAVYYFQPGKDLHDFFCAVRRYQEEHDT